MYIDLLQIQRFSFLKFLQSGINQVFDNINPIIIANRKYVFFAKYYLLKIPSQIDFISINNQFQPLKLVNEPSNSLNSHSIFRSYPIASLKVKRQAEFDILSLGSTCRFTLSEAMRPNLNKAFTMPSQIRYDPNYLNSNFYSSRSNLKFAQWLRMSRTQNSERLQDYYDKKCLFQRDTIPINVNFSSSFFCFGILGWREPEFTNSVKNQYYNKKSFIFNKLAWHYCKSNSMFKSALLNTKTKSYCWPLSKIADLQFNKQFLYCNNKLNRKYNYFFNSFPLFSQELQQFKKHQVPTFLKLSKSWLMAIFNNQKSEATACKYLLWLPFKPKPKYQEINTIPKKIMLKSSIKNITSDFFFKQNHISSLKFNSTRQWLEKDKWPDGAYGSTPSLLLKKERKMREALNWNPTLNKTTDISSTSLTKTSHLTYSSEFYIPVQIIDQISKKMYLRWLLLADLPIQTKRGHFIINGYPKTVIHQIVRSPGIRFKNEDNQILADIISMRGAWMGIQIVYEKNVKAATFGLKSQNKTTNKPTFQRNSSYLDKNWTSLTENRRHLSNVNEKNTKSSLPGNFSFQPSKYQYRALFIQDAIMKSEKLDYLPFPKLSLLKAKHENKVLEKLKHWPKTLFNLQPMNSGKGPDLLASLVSQNKPYLFNFIQQTTRPCFKGPVFSKHEPKKRLKHGQLSIQEISEKPMRKHNKNQFGSRKHYFWNCPFWTIYNYENKLVSSPIIKSSLFEKPLKVLTPKLFKFPLNSMTESEKINEALSINFFISSSRNDKTDKKRIKLSGFAFLDYLFDHPYFVYNNYVPSWQKSSFFPASVFLESFDTGFSTEAFSSFRRPLNSNLVSDKIWPFIKGRTYGYNLNKNKKSRIHRKNISSITSSIPNELKIGKPFLKGSKVIDPRSLMEGSYTDFLNSYGQAEPVFFNRFTRGETQTKKTITDIFINGYYPTDQYNASLSQNSLLWFLPNQLLNENTHTQLLAPLVNHNQQNTRPYFYTNKNVEVKENYPPYFTTSDTLLKTLTWRFLKKIKQTRFSKIWPLLRQRSLPSLSSDPNIHVSNSFLGSYLKNTSPLKYDLSYTISHPERNRMKLPAELEKETDNSFLVGNTNQNNDVKDFIIQETIDANNRKVSMIKNKNGRLWITTPVISLSDSKNQIRDGSVFLTKNTKTNGVLNRAHKNMYEKYLSIMKDSTVIESKDSIAYSNDDTDNLKVFRPNQRGPSYAEFDKQAWTKRPRDITCLDGNQSEKTISSNRLLASLISILNTTNFRDVLFERFMNAKFYDIGLMGRKRLNKKLRLNVPLQCTTLTPLDFLAIFYKLFSLYNNFSLIQNFFPTEGRTPLKIPFLGDSFALNSKINPWSDSNHSSGSIAFRQLMSTNIKGVTLPLTSPGVGNVFKPRNNLLDSTLKQSGSLDHLNQRHIRTSGEFLFLQFWRAILRFYQVLSQLSSRSNFIKSSYTAAGKTGRNFFSLSSISLFPSIGFHPTASQILGSVSSRRPGVKPEAEPESTVSDEIEYMLPISNNQTHVFKAYGYFNTINSRNNGFNFNSYQYQCFQNTMSGEFVINSNRTSPFPNKITGSYPNNFRRETLNIVINRNDINSILPYTPYFQTQKTVSTCAQFQNFALQQNKHNSTYAQDYRILLSKIDNRQNSHVKSMVDNFISITPKYLIEKRKQKRWWPLLRKADFCFSPNQNRKMLVSQQAYSRTFFNKEEHLKPQRLWPSQAPSVILPQIFRLQARPRVERKSFRWKQNPKSAKPWDNTQPIIKYDPNQATPLVSQAPPRLSLQAKRWGETQERPKNLVSSLDKPLLNSKMDTIIKKLLYETKELRVFDAKERMRNLETKLFNGVFKEFFNLDPLSQDLDETNGLSEIIHKRRISALGKGGVTSKNAPLSIRSIHPSFYGRLCPIDSPEGDRVGLINSLTNYARINSTGYIATPFYRTRHHDHSQSSIHRKHETFSLNQSELTNQYYQTNTLPRFTQWSTGDKNIKINNNTPFMGGLHLMASPILRSLGSHPIASLGVKGEAEPENGKLRVIKQAPYYPGFNRGALKHNNNNQTQISLFGQAPPRVSLQVFDWKQNPKSAKPWGGTQEPGKISLLAKKSTLQMRICPPIAFFGKIYNSYDVSPSLRFSFQDMIYNLNKTKETQKWKIPSQNYAKQIVLNIGSTHIERTYKYFMKSSYLRPYQIKSFPSEISLLERKPIIGNSFIYRSRQSHFQSTKIHDFQGGLEPTPSFGLNKTQQRGPTYSDLIALPKNLKETVQNNFSYTNQNSVVNKDNQKIPRKLELFLFYDTHYMTPPITHRETIINNVKDKNLGHVYTPFLTCYFDFISFQGYVPITAFQFFSPGVGLIPFLEHDDGTRALMGANMQRQAVPLISASRPIVGTGLEKNIAASFIISSSNSGYLYYISGKQSKQIFTGFQPPIDQSHKAYNFKNLNLTISKRLFEETQFLDEAPYFEVYPGSSRFARRQNVRSGVKREAKPESHSYLSIEDKQAWTKRPRDITCLEGNRSKKTITSTVKTVCKSLILNQESTTQAWPRVPLERFRWKQNAKSTKPWAGTQTNYNTNVTFGAPNQKLKVQSKNHQKLISKQIKGQTFSSIRNEYFKGGQHFILNTHWLPYRKSYKATIINKKPAISENSWLQKGDLLVDGTSSINGELALGRNLFSIYMPWEGYNFEDAILISDKAAQGYTTIHVEEFSVKISKNEFVSSIVKPFTWVNLGDILVSKKRRLENEFIMNRLLFGMSSKPKMKSVDNDFLYDTVSNYNFYGDNLFLNLQKRKPSSKKQILSYIISPWQNKLSSHYYKHRQNSNLFFNPQIKNASVSKSMLFDTDAEAMTIINRPKERNWNTDTKSKLPISFYDQSVFENSNTDTYSFYYDKRKVLKLKGDRKENSFKNYDSIDQTKMFGFYKTKLNNILKTKYNYETVITSNPMDISRSRLEFQYTDNPYSIFIPPLFHLCYQSSFTEFWLYNTTSSLYSASLFENMLSNKDASFINQNKQNKLKNKKKILTGHYQSYAKTNDSKRLLPNFKGYYFLQNSEELRSPFYKVTISGETSPIIEQIHITHNEINKDNITMLDDKQSSLLRMNEKDLKLFGPHRETMRPLKKNDNFEIDTSYRTGESICGWVISVKSQYQQSLFSDSENKDRVRVLDTKTRMLEQNQNHSKDSIETPSVQKPAEQNLHVFDNQKYGRVSSLENQTKEAHPSLSDDKLEWPKRPRDITCLGGIRANKKFNTLNTESTIWPLSRRVENIYTGSIQKFLNLLSIFQKNLQARPRASLHAKPWGESQFKNNVFHEIKEPAINSFTNQSEKNVVFQTYLGPSKKSPIGYSLLKNTFKISNFTWKSLKKPNYIDLKWSVNKSKTSSLKKLSFKSSPNLNYGNQSSLLQVNPYNVQKVKTERAPLKITKNSGQRPGGDTIYIYVAVAKPLQVGDKMSGRHGNKGIISKILPFYDMPYLIDGTPIDIVLNPLGVPSRMNVGQIYESLLGLTGFYKQEYYRIPPFDENYSSQFSRNFVYWKLNELKDLHFFTPRISNNTTTNNAGSIIQLSPFLEFGCLNNKRRPCFNVQNMEKPQVSSFIRPWWLTLGFFEKPYPFYYLQTTTASKSLNHLETIKYFKAKPLYFKDLKHEQVSSWMPMSSKLKTLKENGWLSKLSKIITIPNVYNQSSTPFYNAFKTLWSYPKSKIWDPLDTCSSSASGGKETVLFPVERQICEAVRWDPKINWNTSLLWCSKFKIWNQSNNLSKFKSSKIISTNSVSYLESSFKENWFFGLASIKSKPWSSSNRVSNIPFYTQKHRFDTWFINKHRPTVEKFGLNPYFPGKMRLINGLTGETFYRPIIVGKSYMLKLIHLVHHKIHARATGPYALITQQPLKGKRNQGGQRMGEMEIWALYGFGSASILYEMLTIKSDDPVGRERILREIAGLKGNNSSNSNWKNNENSSALSFTESTQFWKNEEYGLGSKVNDSLEKGISESFRVLVMNLRALCLDMQVFKDLPN